ncbi:unnamed protein product [Brachionus calyciflorus]|uniref:MULE transposase domain-containing protein n=1 Tax=Brachionus calyciflorus TaxID=104777 RepID=A0A813XH69_9BILA|nr:unnamed protein product [Brachionus calyciflorus]
MSDVDQITTCVPVGYYYRQNEQQNKKTIFNWRCIKAGCKGTCQTYSNRVGEDVILISINDIHENFHSASPNKIKILERRRKIGHKVEFSDEKPRKILHELNDNNLDDEMIANSANYPPNPKKLSEIYFPDFLTITKKKENFLFDSGADSEFIIFTTESNLQNLKNAHVFVDGTFDIAPKLFAQVYTIHALIDGRCFLMAYGLLSRKTEEMYVEFLNAVQIKLKHHPLSITSDFEKGFINTSMKVFPKVNVFGCFFHFKQSMWRKISELGLKVIYLEDENDIY